MKTVNKYENITKELPKLPTVLLNTIQADILEIKRVDQTCEKYLEACSKIPKFKNARYVVYSKFIEKSNHQCEKFIFLNKEGEELCDVSGAQMDLYGLLACTSLHFSPEYEASASKE